MPVPSIRELIGDNRQLTQIARLGLSPRDEQAYKVALEAEYRQTIRSLTTAHNQPAMVPILETELEALLTMSTEELEHLPARNPPAYNTDVNVPVFI